MSLTDAHVHFWNTALMPCPWLTSVPAIAHAHAPQDLRAETGGEMPSRIVFVDCGSPWLDEVRWVEGLARAEPRIRGIVAKATMNAGEETAAQVAELGRHPLVRGVRHNFEDEKDPDYCVRPAFLEGVGRLAGAGLSFDICCKHHQLASVVELVRRTPQTSFVLDHGGKPGIKAGLLEPWCSNIRALAALPNVVCKFSGLVTEADRDNWTPAQIQPYASALLDSFGPSRLLYGGDWPVVKLASSYLRWLDTARAMTAHLTAAERAAIFDENAARVYRIS